uniref:Uncharacterized protein n=1 Tax=viral metagenome TaxID=1070528 RepID=A0A6H2A1E9_9ZZZZ
MDIAKASVLLQQDLNDPGSVDIVDLNTAQELAIEALTYCQLLRETTPELGPALFYGETKE